MKTIFHITNQQHWSESQELGEYLFCSLKAEGFIHCSTQDQYMRVAKNLFLKLDNLLLLQISEEKINPAVKYENLEGGQELFPHIYGPLNLDSVIKVHPFVKDHDGHFIDPLALA